MYFAVLVLQKTSSLHGQILGTVIKKISHKLQQLVLPRIPGWFRLEGTLKLIYFQSPAMARDTFHQIRLLRFAYENPSSRTVARRE